MTQRLIETWLPIAALGEESVRERRSMTALPPVYYLHIWWARRPLIASRAAILASLLPADADRDKFMHILGIHGDPVASRRRIDNARRSGDRFKGEAYSYRRAFTYCPTDVERAWIKEQTARCGADSAVVLDPTAGGGSIPFEASRLGFTAYANDLNPVAALILRATIEFPSQLGYDVLDEFQLLAKEFVARREERLKPFFPPEPETNCIPTNYLWARTITCPYCDGAIPLSPNWRLAPDGTGVRLHPDQTSKRCTFEIVKSAKEQTEATVTRGDAKCPYPGCGRIVEGDEVKRQAQAGGMGEQLFAVVFKRKIVTRTKTGKEKVKWESDYRAASIEDDNGASIERMLEDRLPEWEANGVVPTERLPMDTESWTHGNTPAQFGAECFLDLFTPRQRLVHGISADVYRELVAEGKIGREALAYLAMALDKLVDYNSRTSAWHSGREVTEHTFRDHAYPLKWSFSEMAPSVDGSEWATRQAGKCIKELIKLVRPDLAAIRAHFSGGLQFDDVIKVVPPTVAITCQSGDSLTHIADVSVDCVVMDPPYYDNLMYSELSDFFYVWLKRTAGRVYPELFRRHLTDKTSEAVANVAKFDRQKGAKALAARDYQQRMAGIFAECRRVLKRGRHHDADVHAQGHRRLGRACVGSYGGRLHHYRLVAGDDRVGKQPPHQE